MTGSYVSPRDKSLPNVAVEQVGSLKNGPAVKQHGGTL